jgi:hypothetical protein
LVLAQISPEIGVVTNILGTVYCLALFVVATKTVHGLSWGKAIIPGILLLVVGMVFIALLFIHGSHSPDPSSLVRS